MPTRKITNDEQQGSNKESKEEKNNLTDPKDQVATTSTLPSSSSSTKDMVQKPHHQPQDLQEYEILYVQPIGKGFRYNIKFINGETKWIPGREVDQKILSDFLINKSKTTLAKLPKLLNTSNVITIIVLLFFFINSISAFQIEDKFTYCQTKGLNRLVKPNPDCTHPKEIKRYLAIHNTMLDEVLHREKLPSDIMLLSRNKYFLNEIGYQCFQSRRTTYLNETWTFKTTRKEEIETIHLSRLQMFYMLGELCQDGPASLLDTSLIALLAFLLAFAGHAPSRHSFLDCRSLLFFLLLKSAQIVYQLACLRILCPRRLIENLVVQMCKLVFLNV